MKKLLCLFALPLLFLSGCWNTSVVTEEEKKLPASSGTEFSKEELSVNTSQSHVSFVGKKGDLVSHEGKFENFTAAITLDEETPKNLEKAKVAVTIDVSSMKTDSDGLTKHLIGEEFFNASTHPIATFNSEDILKKEGNLYAVSGDLTIKGLTKTVFMEAEITNEYALINYEINRLDFTIGEPGSGVKAIDENVPLSIKLVFEK